MGRALRWDKDGGGAAIARSPVPATERERLYRAQLRADAAAYLIRTGHEDLLPVLGLEPPADGGA